jgi:hypothetical protein
VELGGFLARNDLRARGCERQLVGGVVLEERDADHDEQRRDQGDVQHLEEDDGENDVEQPEEPRRHEHPQREAGVAAVRPAFHGAHCRWVAGDEVEGLIAPQPRTRAIDSRSCAAPG